MLRSIFSSIKSYHFIILFIGIYLILYYLLSSDVIIDTTYEHSVNAETIDERVHFHQYEIYHGCSTKTNTCFSVVDKRKLVPLEEDTYGNWMFGEPRRLEETVERHMIVDGFADDSDTVVRILPAEGSHLSFDNSDTRMWTVDHTDIRSQYVAALIAAPFLTATLSLFEQDNDNKTVLEVGLGGGSLDMFLHHYYPKMNITAVELDPIVVDIAREWFGIRDDEHRKTVLDDGIQFVKKAAAKGETYDVVFLDACDDNKDLPCPAKDFTEFDFLTDVKKIIKENGVFVVNVLSLNDAKETVISRIYQHFNSCIRVYLSIEINEILVCTSHTMDPSYLQFLNSRIPAVILHLSLPEFLVKIENV